MYNDPALIKKHHVRVRLDDYLNGEIEALCTVTGAQKAVLCRQLIEIGLKEIHSSQSIPVINSQEGLLNGLLNSA